MKKIDKSPWTRRAIHQAFGVMIVSGAVLVPISAASAAPETFTQVKASAPAELVCGTGEVYDDAGNLVAVHSECDG